MEEYFCGNASASDPPAAAPTTATGTATNTASKATDAPRARPTQDRSQYDTFACTELDGGGRGADNRSCEGEQIENEGRVLVL